MSARHSAKEPRFFLSQDSSCHWYLVPVQNRKEWELWANLDDDDPASWDSPAFAKRLNGHPARMTFTDPRGGVE